MGKGPVDKSPVDLMNAMRPIIIATRKSPLALWQANYARAQLQRHHRGRGAVLLEVVCEGDKTLDAPLATIGGKGLFLKELEQALLRGAADVAVHSMKDVPTALPAGLRIAAICARADPRDAVVSGRGGLAQLPPGARVGTCSLRRQCQIRARFPHLRLVDLRGNVNTRLAKLERGDFAAIVLAAAGLQRLQLAHRISEYLPPHICLPAAGQGAIGLECRADDAAMLELLAAVNHPPSAACVAAERAVVERLGGGCQAPLAVYARRHLGITEVRALVGSVDGATVLRSRKFGRDGIATARLAAADLLAQGAAALLAEVYGR